VNDREVKAAMQAIADDMLENDPEGVHWLRIREEIKRNIPADTLHDLMESYIDDLLGRWAKDIASSLRRGNQPTLPGFGWDSTVTVQDGEGSYRVKHLRYATDFDLSADVEIHEANVSAASAALAKAKERNRTLLPIMAERGFKYAGDALEFLTGQRP